MALIRWRSTSDPFAELDDLRNAVNRLFGDLADRPLGLGLYRGVFPALNISETDDHLTITAEIPGINAKEIDITATADSLTIKGERKAPELGDDVSYHQREREFGTFRRIVDLPTRVNPEKISASYKNGVLTILLPKAEEIKPKQIEVTTS